ncbi:MAG: hypothetical protein RSC28_02435 [Bacteroidales bacterium]
MQFSNVIGHNGVIENIRNMVDTNRIPHAILFTEKFGYGALTLALATIKYMFCKDKNNGDSCGKCSSCRKIEKLVHPDLHFTFPTNTSTLIGKDKKSNIDEFYPLWRELVIANPYFSEQELYKVLGIENKFGIISVNEANTIMSKLSLSSYEGGNKIMLIVFPERMNQEAANKLLKSLEEPQPDTYYFLISHAPGKIISTILSRCRIIELLPIQDDALSKELVKNYSLTQEEALFWAKCSGGSYGKALELIEQEGKKGETYTVFISILELAINKDLASMFDIWDSVSLWGKENQKALCVKGIEILRKLYIINLNLNSIVYASPKEQELLKKLSGKIKNNFYEKGYNYLNSAIDCIERNVNPKFIFCDLCNRIYYNI